jgi:uncharacterized protein DUF4258
MARRLSPRTGKRFALYWCTTADGDEDWFVVASSAREARRYHEDAEGFDRGEAAAERVLALPPDLCEGGGWKDGRAGPVRNEAGWPSDELLISCGGEIATLPRDAFRAMMGVVTKDVRFGARVFRAGDVVTNLDRKHGVKEARLSTFAGLKARRARPAWWDWELEFTPHVEKRMADRGFTEVDIRELLDRAVEWRPSAADGRFLIRTRFRRRRWEVVVEPDELEHLLVVVTAYGFDP